MVHNHEILFRKSQKHALSSNPYKLSVLMVLCQKCFLVFKENMNSKHNTMI